MVINALVYNLFNSYFTVLDWFHSSRMKCLEFAIMVFLLIAFPCLCLKQCQKPK